MLKEGCSIPGYNQQTFRYEESVFGRQVRGRDKSLQYAKIYEPSFVQKDGRLWNG